MREGSQVVQEELKCVYSGIENYGRYDDCNGAGWPDVGEGILLTDAG